MKGILQFKLPEDQEEFRLAQQGGALQAAVFSFSNLLRSYDKHGIPENLQTLEDLIEHLREKLRDALDHYEITGI